MARKNQSSKAPTRSSARIKGIKLKQGAPSANGRHPFSTLISTNTHDQEFKPNVPRKKLSRSSKRDSNGEKVNSNARFLSQELELYLNCHPQENVGVTQGVAEVSYVEVNHPVNLHKRSALQNGRYPAHHTSLASVSSKRLTYYRLLDRVHNSGRRSRHQLSSI